MRIFYDPRCLEYSSPGHPERPERIARTAPLIKQRHPDWEWRGPHGGTDNELLRAHSDHHIEGVTRAPADFEIGMSDYSDIGKYARHSAGGGAGGAPGALPGR